MTVLRFGRVNSKEKGTRLLKEISLREGFKSAIKISTQENNLITMKDYSPDEYTDPQKVQNSGRMLVFEVSKNLKNIGHYIPAVMSIPEKETNQKCFPKEL